MTNQNAKNNLPADKNPQAQGKRELARQPELPNARWNARVIGVAAAYGLTALACGGDAVGNEPILPNNPLPPGVCSDIQARVTEVGITSVNLNEAILKAGESVKLGSDEYRLSVLGVSSRNEQAAVLITDKDGNPVAFLRDQDGEEMANLNSIEVGDSWTFVLPDGREITVTLCAIVFDLDGNAHAVLKSNGFDWCTTVDRTVENTQDYNTIVYGTEHIETVVHESGEAQDRADAECTGLNGKVVEETATLEVPMQPGTQPEDATVRVLGEEWSVITLSNYGYILLGKSVMAGEVGVGETLLGDGVTVLVNEVSNYGGTYKADITITVAGVQVEMIEGAVAGNVLKVSVEGQPDRYVRVNEVTSDGKVRLEILSGPIKLQDGATYTDASGNVWRVELTKVGGDFSSGVSGWHLVAE